MNDVVRPVSRLPRPVVAGRSRTQPAGHRPVRASQVHHGPSLPLIDLGNGGGTRRSRRSSVADGNSIFQESINSRIPVPSVNDHVTTAFNNYRRSSHSRDRLLVQRPQTSCSTEELSARGHRRKTSSGKTHLLKKLQTMSLGSHTDISTNVDDVDSSSRFARLQPLPAIIRPTLESSEMSSSEAESSLDFQKDIGVEPGQTVNDHLNEADFPTNDENIEVQRPATSYFSKRPDSVIIKEASGLVRSRTYDIIPTGNTINDWTIKEDDEETEESEDSDPVGVAVGRSEDPSGDRLAAATEVGLLLAIRSPSADEEDQWYGYFKDEDKVQTILDFYQEVTGKSNVHCHLAHQEDNGEQRCLDSESTIAEAKLSNRAVVHLVRPVDRTDETNDDETLDEQPHESEETIT